ncbi:hypothetical protein GIY62_21530 [Burkholderia plantarii]|nr:hypothetical protein [Burkholderia plantarii]WLE62945.1 hypothetical protein GIY62_21530 [Burkholderia plantarii]
MLAPIERFRIDDRAPAAMRLVAMAAGESRAAPGSARCLAKTGWFR